MKRGWWKGAVALVVSVGLFAQHLEVAHASEAVRTDGPISVGGIDSTPCLVNDPIYDPVGDVCAALDRMETTAVQTVKQVRGITGGSDTDVRNFAAADVRAELFAQMLSAIKKPAASRTADESVVVTWLQNAQKRLNIKIAQQALTEFTAYDGPAGNTGEGAGWCTYTPPAPYENDRPAWSPCSGIHNPLGDLFTLPPTYPDAETWVKWGAAKIKGDRFTLAGYGGSTDLSAAAIAGIAGSAVGVAAGSAIAALTATLGATFISTITPYAVLGFFQSTVIASGATSAQALAGATASMFGAAAFVVVVVALALYGIIYSGLQVFERANIRTELLDGIANAQASALPNLTAVAETSEGVGQLYDLISTYMTINDPLTPIASPAPARTASDMLFGRGGGRTVTTTIRKWDGTSGTLEMRGGYLVLDGVATTGAKVVDREGNPVTMFRAKTSSGAWGFVLVPANSASGSCLSGTVVSCPISIDANVLDGTGAYVPLSSIADAAPLVNIDAQARTSGGSTYDLRSSASWNGQNVSGSTIWWRPDATTHVSGIFTSTVSVCLPWTDPVGTEIPADPDTELYNGVCYRKFATGATAAYSVVSSAPVTIRASVTSPSGLTGNATRQLAGNQNVQTLTLTPPTPATVDEGQVWVLTGQVVDPGGSAQSISVAVDWHDGTGVQNYTIPPAGTTSLQLGFSSNRSGNTSTFTLSKNLNDEASGNVTVTTTGSATAAASTAFAARNVAPTVDSISIDGCDGTPSCVLTPGQTVTVRGRITDIGVLDDPTATVSFSGGTPVTASLTAGRFIRVTSIGSAQTPMPWDFAAQLTVPTTGLATTTVTVAAADGDGGTGSRTKNYDQYLPFVVPASATATASGPDSIDVAYIAIISLGSTLAVTWHAECRSTDGTSVQTGTGTSPIRVTGLVLGKTYSCKVFSRSAVADSPSVTAANVTLSSGTPATPTQVAAATDGPNRLRVSFTAPVAADITYRAVCTSTDGGVARSAAGGTSPLAVGGLTAAASYTCKVSGSTATTKGTASEASSPVVVIGLPGAPTAVTPTVSGPNSASVAFTPPASDGSSAITGYRAQCTSSTGGTTRGATGTASPIVVRALTAGATYTCVVSGTNAAGTTLSAPSASFVALGLPGQPTGIPSATSPTAVDPTFAGKVQVTFGAPASDGGTPIVSYTARCTATDGVTIRSATGTASPIIVTGFPGPSKVVSCIVTATNSLGTGPASVASGNVLVANAPAKPAAPAVTLTAAGRVSAVVTPPASLLQFPITGYRVVCSSIGGTARSAAGVSNTLVVTGLTVGRSYTCVAAASNALGTSGAGPASVSFTA